MLSKSCKNTGRASPSIETFAAFLEANGGEASAKRGTSTLSQEAFLARTSAVPDAEPALTEQGPDSGASSHGSFAYFDRDTSSWKTLTLSLFEGSVEFSRIWPRSGTMRNGIASRLPPLVPRIVAGGSSLLPTPTKSDGEKKNLSYYHGRNLTLLGAVSKIEDDSSSDFMAISLPTPRAAAGSHGGRIRPRKLREGDHLIEALSAGLFPTPRTSSQDNCGDSNSRRTAKANGSYIGRTLNPGFVEWMMGFPPRWTELPTKPTACADLETQSSPN